MIRLMLNQMKAYRKYKGGKWYKVINFTGGGKCVVYWKQEEDLQSEYTSVLTSEDYKEVKPPENESETL